MAVIPDSIRATLRRALTEYGGEDGAAALHWLAGQPVEALSERELDVVRLVAQGYSNDQIAAILSIAEKTVRSHMANILSKLDMHNRTQVAIWAIKRGLVVWEDEGTE